MKRSFNSGNTDAFRLRFWRFFFVAISLLGALSTADLKAKDDTSDSIEDLDSESHRSEEPYTEESAHTEHGDSDGKTEHASADDHGPKIIAIPSDPIPRLSFSAANWKMPVRGSSIDPITSGSPNYIHFSPEIFDGTRDFRGVAQHSDGRIYVIVGPHLYVGTGTSWQRLPTAPAGDLSALYLASDDRLYLASTEDFGFLDLGEAGDPLWKSIRTDLPEEWMQGHAWEPAYEDSKGNAYFISDSAIVSHHPVNPLQVWRKIEGTDHVFSLRGEVYALTKDLKVYRLEANGRSEIVQRDLPLSYGDIRGFVPYDDERLLVAAGAEGLALYDGELFEPFELNEFVGSKLVVDQLMPFGEDLYVVIDYENGMLVFRSDGTLLRQVQRIGGLKLRIAKALTVDRQGWMWLAHSSGLYRVDVASEGLSFNHHDGLEGVVHAVCEHDKGFYVGTSAGLFLWNGTEFTHISGIPAVESLISTAEGLSIGTKRGLYVYHGGHSYLVDKGQRPYVFKSHKASQYLLTPTEDGIYAYNLFSRRWRPATEWSKLPTSGLGVVTDAGGNLWGEYGPGRLAYFDFDAEMEAPVIYTPKEGLPLSKIVPVLLEDSVFFLAGNDVLRFLSDRKVFTRSDGWQQLGHEPGVQPAQRAIQDPEGHLWVPESKAQHRYMQLPPAGLEYSFDDILEYGQDPLTLAKLDSAGHLWVGNSYGLRRYIQRTHTESSSAIPVTLIHRIESNGETLANFAAGTSKVLLQGLPANTKNIRITYSVIEYGQPAGVTYSSKLEGYNKSWQPFTKESTKEYNSLLPGAYAFHVSAKTMKGREASPAVVEFYIPVAFHQTMGAKALVVLAGFLFLGVAYYLVRKNAVRRIRSLEESVSTMEAEGSKNTSELEVKERLLAKSLLEKKKLKEETEILVSEYGEWRLRLSQQFRPSVTMMSKLSMLLSNSEKKDMSSDIVRGLRMTGESLVGGMRDLLDLRRITTEDICEKKITYDLQDVIDEVLESVAAAATAQGIGLISHIEKEVNPERIGNPARVAEVLSPLVVAALALAEEEDLTLVVTKAEGKSSDFVQFAIHAKGQDWDENMQEHVLSLSDPEALPVYRGRPQGVSLARQLMKSMQGTFAAYGGKEESFGYDISLCQPPKPKQEDAPAEVLPFSERLVLVLDNNPHALKGLQASAERMGFQVRLANNGPQAKEALKETPKPDIAWIDLDLDEEDGLKVLASIRELDDFAEMPALILASKMEAERMGESDQDSLSLFVAKPANHRILKAASGALLDSTKPEGQTSDEAEKPDEAESNPVPSEDVPVDEEEDPIEAKIRAALAKSEAQMEGSEDGKAVTKSKSTLPVTVLLADGHKAGGAMMEKVLNHLGRGVKVVDEASAVLSSLENDSYQLLLLSHPLGESEVTQIAKQIHDNLPAERVPIIISMGAQYPEDSAEAGIDDHIRLPLSVSDLRLVLRLVDET